MLLLVSDLFWQFDVILFTNASVCASAKSLTGIEGAQCMNYVFVFHFHTAVCIRSSLETSVIESNCTIVLIHCWLLFQQSDLLCYGSRSRNITQQWPPIPYSTKRLLLIRTYMTCGSNPWGLTSYRLHLQLCRWECVVFRCRNPLYCQMKTEFLILRRLHCVSEKRDWCSTLWLRHRSTNFNYFWQRCCWESIQGGPKKRTVFRSL